MEEHFTDEELKSCFKLHLIYRDYADEDFGNQYQASKTNQLYEWPSDTKLYCSISKPFKSSKHENISGTHAEIHLLDDLRSQFETEQMTKKLDEQSLSDAASRSYLNDKGAQMVTISITQNYSPCCDCAEKIIDFIDECKMKYNYRILMYISFGLFYKYSKNKTGLVNLLVSGVDLQLIEDDLKNRIKIVLNKGLDGLESSKMEKYFSKRDTLDKSYLQEIQKEKEDKKKKEEKEEKHKDKI